MSDDLSNPTPPTPPAPPPPPPPPPIVYQVVQPSNGLATASLVLGILGIALFWFLGFIMSILAIVFGGVGLSRAKAGAPGKGTATAGLILGIVGLLLPLLLIFALNTSSRHMQFG